MTATGDDSRGAATAVTALNLVESLERAQREEPLRRSFQRFIEDVGFTSFTCARLARSRGGIDASRLLNSTRPAGFHETYLARGYANHDPLLREAVRRRRPFQWSQVTRERKLTRAEQDVLRYAASFGLKDGFAVPIRDSGGFIGLINLAGPAIELDEETRAALILVAPYVYQRVCRLKEGAGPTQSITAREAEILTWIAKGKSDWQIGKILGISGKTVNYHIENVKRKFGVASRIQAVVAALMPGSLSHDGAVPSPLTGSWRRPAQRPQPKREVARRTSGRRPTAPGIIEGD